MIFATDCDSDIFRSVIAYLNPVLVYISILYCSKKEISILCRIISKILVLFIIVGILQTVGVISFLQPVISFLIPRASTESLGFGGRGVTIFSSEPSRAAYEVIFIYIAWRYIHQTSVMKQLFFDFFVVFFVLFIIRSSLGLLVLLVFLLSEYRLKFILSGLIVVLISLPLLINSNSRAIVIMISIISRSSFDEIYTFLLSASGFRLISIVAAYKYGFLHPFGGGIGLWLKTSIDALYQTGINSSNIDYFNYVSGGNFSPIRPTSYLASMVLDMGWIAILVNFYLIKPLFKFISFNNRLFSLIITFLFCMIIIGDIGSPIPWLCMALCYRVYKKNKKNNYQY
jgi:hypothetical protein